MREAANRIGIDIRIGLHAGEIEITDKDVRGISVHIAARVSAQAQSNQIVVSRTVKDLVAGSGLNFDYLGEHELKGVPDTWQLYLVK